jgi:hypothetical protein
MRRVAVLAIATALLSIAGAPAFAADAQSPADAPTAKPAKKMDDPSRVICTREHVVGSNRPQKVCMTVAQREELRDAARRTMDDSRKGTGEGLNSNPSQ